ncbi:FAD-dependent oxidoreductase [Streptomyces cyaneofuscatus]|uniref:FAD-dependent oxidoreductase n=1 Tax=Streptomyces cyaneofuscatus TaxID=66883 RepID=UPI0033DFA666
MEPIDVAVIGGGQSGLATAHMLLRHGLRPVVLESSGCTAGSWPHYYDSLTLFSPARYSSLPGMPFPGADPDRAIRIATRSSPTSPPTPTAWTPAPASVSASPP